jgi:hypothetical protein
MEKREENLRDPHGDEVQDEGEVFRKDVGAN